MSSSVVLLGCGPLSRSVCYSLAVGSVPMAVTVVARNSARAAEMAYVGNTRAALAGSRVRCRAVPGELSDPRALGRVLGATLPDVVLLTSSYQSPWEDLASPSPWTRLVARAGDGLTAPLHAMLAVLTADVVAQTGRARLLVACLPDAVNPMLAGLGLPVFTGVGGVALIAASLKAALYLDDHIPLRVLAHHLHLREPASAAEEARAWVNEVAVPDVTSALTAQRLADRRALAIVVGHSTALLISDLITGAEIHTSLPGPLGLPGGYPVRITDGIELDLPAGLSTDAAVAWNRTAARRDGIDVDGDTVRFSEPVLAALEPYLPGLADGFPLAALDSVGARLLALRARLRGRADP
jgi:hypothetical protein